MRPGTGAYQGTAQAPGCRLSQCRVRASSSQCMGAAGGHNSFCAVHGRAREHGHAGAVPAIPHSESDGRGAPACHRRTHTVYRLLSQQGEIYQRRSAEDRQRFRRKCPPHHGRAAHRAGAARKTASVVLGVAYGLAEGIVVDTHVLRISRRLHLTRETDPKKVEQDLMKIIPRDRWISFSHEVIHHGRQTCIARKPKCAECPLENLCTSADKTWSSH